MIGELLGPYRLEKELGSGGMGKVYLGRVEGDAPGLLSGERVAVKVIYPHLVADIAMFTRFLNEVNVGKRIRHENVVRTIDAGMALHDDGESVYLAMEYVAGQTLGELRKEKGRLPEERCRSVAREVARALGGVHAAGVVHRDLKPDNVLITSQGVVKVMDLGVALLREEALRRTVAGEFAGSMLYAAPEQFSVDGAEIDARVDLYSLGVTLYELASGEQPFAADDFRVILTRQLSHVPPPLVDLGIGVSPFFSEVVVGLMEKEPDARIRSADELFRILSQAEQSRWWRRRAARSDRGDAPPLRRLDVPRRTAMVGRERELNRLRRLFDEAAEGSGRVVLIEGEAGVGKSRLVDELVGLIDIEGTHFDFLFGRPLGLGTGPGHEVLLEAMDAHYGVDALSGLVPDDGDPVNAGTLQLLSGGACIADVESEAAARLTALLVEVLEGAAAEQPIVLLFEELHDCSLAGRDLFLDLADRIQGLPVLLVATVRERVSAAFRGRFADVPHAEVLELERLSRESVELLISGVLGGGGADEHVVDEVLQQSGGNALFALEVLHSIRERQLIRQTAAGLWSAVRPMAELGIPDALRHAFGARLAGLDEDARLLLQIAACIGQRFAPPVIAAVLELDTREVRRSLAALAKRKLVHRDDDAFVFDQRSLRRLVYSELSELEREHYHGAVGDVLLERAGSAPDGAEAAAIARNLLRSDRPERAKDHLPAAFAYLHRRGHHNKLVALAQHALEVEGLFDDAERPRVLAFHALALTARGRVDAAVEALEDLIERLP